MDPELRQALAGSFSTDSRPYAESRPTYPELAVAWMVGPPPRRILDLAAGTGLFTELLCRAGHRVTAADRNLAMLAALSADCDSPAVQCEAEELPLADDSFDVVTVATAFHWFAADRALPEIARVLVPAGTLALTWNTRDESTSFARRLGSLLQRVQPVPGHGDWATRSVTAVADSALFGPLGYAEFSLVQHITRDQLVGLVASRSYVIALPEARRAELLDEVGRLFDADVDFVTERGSGELSMALPYRTQCWRTVRR